MDISNKKHFLTVKDYSVSKETFDLYHDETLDMLITHPQPSLENLGKYYESEDYISHTDNKRSLFEKLYHFIKNIALKNKLNLINSHQPNKGRILDIGAGTGDFLSVAKKDGWQTIGVEPSTKAKSIAINKGVSFVELTTELENNSFDVISMWHVLEHVPDLDKQIKELGITLTPLHPETELRKAGVIFESNTALIDFFATHVVIDDEQRFVTGQNQNSGLETSHKMMAIISKR